MSIAFIRFTIDVAVVFRNKEDKSVVEGGVINLQINCAKAGQRSVPKQRRFLFIRWEFGGRGGPEETPRTFVQDLVIRTTIY